MEENNKKDNNTGGIWYILISIVLTGFLYFIFESGNISIKGIESNRDTQPFAFYTTMAILFVMCFSIFLYGVSRYLGLFQKQKKDDFN